MPRLADLLAENDDKRALTGLAKKSKTASRDRSSTEGTTRRGAGRNNKGAVHIPVPDFVAIDLETTGLDIHGDRVTEVGLVRFSSGRPTAEFSSLVNPGIPIPPLITDLTGINDQTVAQAPRFAEVMDQVMAFIGDAILCGHQIDFDFSFLSEELKRHNRPKLTNSQLDTASLSRLTLVDLPGYTLGQVAASLGIALVNAHRALDDARASGLVAAALIPKLAEIPENARTLMARFAPTSALKLILVRSVDRSHRGEIQITGVPMPPPPGRLAQPRDRIESPLKLVKECFGGAGPLSKVMDGYTPRDSQVRMAREVATALNEDRFLAAEAGTGTGKSLAYLVPAALWARANKTRVLVSTHTRNLQDQLVTKDLPLAAKVVGGDFTFSVLKGRANYLCRNRWQQLLSGALGNLSPRERMGILPLIRWSEITTTGDIEEQRLFNRNWFGKVWNLISAQAHECLGRRCPFFGDCYLQHARQRALGSHVVVINHALFFSEICSESSFLGRIGSIVFDEAHHIESAGHRHLRVELDTNRMVRYVDFLSNLLKAFGKDGERGDRGELMAQYKAALKRIRRDGTAFLQDLGTWVTTRHPDTPVNYQLPYPDSSFDALPSKAGLEITLTNLQDTLRGMQHAFATDDDDEGTAVAIASCADRTSQLKADMAYLTRAATENHVFWIEGSREKGWVKLCGVPLDIGGLLADIWERSCTSAIFTSATLSVADSMDFFLRKAGLDGRHRERTHAETFPSPFLERQMHKNVVRGPLEPSSPGFDSYVAETIARLVAATERNTLVLFTARSMLQDVYRLLHGSPLLPAGVTVLAQDISGARHSLVEKLRELPRTVLLGTDSYWEGIDAPGQACEIVVIPRLPFPVPTHPLTVALAQRAEALHGESFFSYAVPEAVIKFRQGAGRLIRSSSDTGALVVLDGRMASKGYGKAFSRSLGNGFAVHSGTDELVKSVQEFFANPPSTEGYSYEPVEES